MRYRGGPGEILAPGLPPPEDIGTLVIRSNVRVGVRTVELRKAMQPRQEIPTPPSPAASARGGEVRQHTVEIGLPGEDGFGAWLGGQLIGGDAVGPWNVTD